MTTSGKNGTDERTNGQWNDDGRAAAEATSHRITVKGQTPMDGCGDRTASSSVDGEQRTDDEQRPEVVRWRCTTKGFTSDGDGEREEWRRRAGGSGTTMTDGWRWNDDDGRAAAMTALKTI
ncbi:hypothetical protein M422DRAFT_271505 [Sphaerobolus stellatus SS14]|uniref:Unplaced genomic scaffold SPHSTscaffold_263, whole genome shotgun sequence n=1 Tax=Sphaerobolus stellatus (strain SS14) TaxID=990650 RepID=A0A0C9UED7_SPHS4|nr:hypothetical protein M422DRAFT_271505 [Sphaerobolus stellatus SS14]